MRRKSFLFWGAVGVCSALFGGCSSSAPSEASSSDSFEGESCQDFDGDGFDDATFEACDGSAAPSGHDSEEDASQSYEADEASLETTHDLIAVVSESGEEVVAIFDAAPPEWIDFAQEGVVSDARLDEIVAYGESQGFEVLAGEGGIEDTYGGCVVVGGTGLPQHVKDNHVWNSPGGILQGPSLDAALTNRAITDKNIGPPHVASGWFSAPDANEATKQTVVANCKAIGKWLTSNPGLGLRRNEPFSHLTNVLGRACNRGGVCWNAFNTKIYVNGIQFFNSGVGHVATSFPYNPTK